jgi:hypothetical protein
MSERIACIAAPHGTTSPPESRLATGPRLTAPLRYPHVGPAGLPDTALDEGPPGAASSPSPTPV